MGNATIRISALVVATLAVSSPAFAQSSPPLSVCNTQPQAAACTAVRGDRADGWAAQSRAEVMAPHGMVTTSQPLAAQAGLQILMNGGNAIDAAVATAAVLNLVEPMNIGVGGDLFAIIYIAKEKKTLHPERQRHGAERRHARAFQRARLSRRSEELGAGLRHAALRHPDGHGAGHRLGLGRGAEALRHEDLQGGAGSRPSTMPRTASRSRSASPTTGACPMRCRCRAAAPSSIPDSVKTWYIDGKRPVAGQIYRNPDLAKTFRLLQKGGRDAFYKGEIARAIVAKSQRARRHHDDGRPRQLQGRMGRGRREQLSRLRRARAAAAVAGLGGQRDAQHPGSLRAEMGAGPDAGEPRAAQSEILAPHGRGQEARLSRTSMRSTPIRIS